MKTYKVTIKEIYNYEIEALNKEEAIQKVHDIDWNGHDEQDRPLEVSAEEI